MKRYHYKATIKWTGNTGRGTKEYRAYNRDYIIRIKNKPVIKGSSDPSFLGDKAHHNPEELFLASISSCHMLWYLHMCSINGITVMDYEDNAEGEMVEENNGAGHFESVTLKPIVTILEKEKSERAIKLHRKANQMCFIANSCNFDVLHDPVLRILNE